MDLIWEGIRSGFYLLVSGNREVLQIVSLSLMVSGLAVIFSLIIGIPAGTFLALTYFPGKRLIITLVNTGMGLPPVVVGLFVILLFWRSGPLGFLDFLYTPSAMIIAQVIIATPVVMGLSIAAIGQLNPGLYLQTLSLGASRIQLFLTLIKEARLPILAAVMAGFGAIISEVGAVMMAGGNIRNRTRVLTTAIVTEARMGHFDMAIALTTILFVITFALYLALTIIQQRRKSL